MSSFGLIEENMELSHIHLAVCNSFISDFLVFWANLVLLTEEITKYFKTADSTVLITKTEIENRENFYAPLK